MTHEEIQAIIDFAIGKEQEAVDFYLGLAERVKNEAVRIELGRMADMERGHKAMLMRLDLDAFIGAPTPQVPDLKIADYTTDAIAHTNMSWPDIINIAMHRELAAARLYQDLAKIMTDERVRRVFENLASEELKHKHYLESIWDEQVMKQN